MIQENLGDACHQPKVAVGLQSDALQLLAAHFSVYLLDRIARFPGGIEYLKVVHSHLAAVITAEQVTHRSGCIFHLGIPAAAAVASFLYRSTFVASSTEWSP